MKKPTKRQQQLLDLIEAHLTRYGAPPTRAELAQQLGLRAVSTVDQHLQALANKGYLDLRPGLNRNIRVKQPDPQDSQSGANRSGALELPLIGRVAAGAPILAAEHVESLFQVDPALFTPIAHFLLRVRGLSMRDAGILDGDLLAVHSGASVVERLKNGEIVVARLDDEVTVKRFERNQNARDRIRLLPENPDYSPIEIDCRRQHLAIEGIVVGVIRNERF